jgi:multidrug efflux pump
LLIVVELKSGTRPHEAAAVLAELEKGLANLPERESVLSLVGPADGFARPEARCFVQLRPAAQRRPLDAVQADVRKAAEKLPGARATVHQVVFHGGRPMRKRTFEVVIEGEGFEAVSRHTARLRDALAESGFVAEVQSDNIELQPWVHFTVKRDEAARLGVRVQACYDVLAAAQGGLHVGDLEAEGRKHTVYLDLGGRAGQGADLLRGLAVRGPEGRVVALADLAEVQRVAVVSAVYRYDGKRGARITGNVAPGRTPQQAWMKCQELATELGLPEGGALVPWGDFRDRVR